MGFIQLFRRIWPYLAPVIGAFAITKVLDLNFGDLVAFFESAQPFILSAKPAWLIIAAACFYFFYVHLKHRHMPLTVLDTHIQLVIESADGSRATLTRTQKIRANHYGVEGYHRYVSVPPPGKIPKDRITCTIDHCSEANQKIYFDGDEQAWEFTHRFNEIPRSFWMLGLNSVERTERISIINGYKRDIEDYVLKVPEHYPHKKITLDIYFDPDRTPEIENCDAMKISNNGVTDVELRPLFPRPELERNGIRLDIKGSPGERYKVVWKYPPMKVLKA